MRKILTTVCCMAAAAAFAGEPMMKVTEKPLDRKGEKLTVKTWNVNFHHSTMNAKNTLKADGKLTTGAWGDFFFGLGHGTINNGSWSGWEFLEAYDMQGKNIMKAGPVKDVTFVKFDGGSYVNFKWEKGEVRILQMQNLKDWIFVKVTIPSGIKQTSLVVYPGGTHWNIKGRERRLKIADKDLELKGWQAKEIPFAGTECGIAFYSRNYNEQYGNFLVFEPSKVTKLTGSEGNSMTVRFFAKQDVKEMCFALGYFAKEAPADATQRFLVERLPNVKKSLDSVNWDPKADLSSFEATFKQVQQLVSSMDGAKKADTEKQLNAIRASFDKAKASSDAAGCAKALDELRALQKSVGSASLKDLL